MTLFDLMSVSSNGTSQTDMQPITSMPNMFTDVSNTTPNEIVADGSAISREKLMRISWDDATWILTCSFIIFTMQSGFGLLESGCVNVKHEVNIMVKNAVDVIFGGITFWAFGFGLAFGTDPGSNWFCGIGYFLVDADSDDMGWVFSWFIFQMSFATTATTIVSGSMAERTKLISYIVFSFLNTLVYCFPAHWVWAEQGFLYRMGCVDIAGSGAVHLVGGVIGLVATVILKPRLGRFEGKSKPPMGCPTNVLLGMFMLWWGWLGFNCGSTFGISGGKWKLAARSAVATVMSSMGGGAVGLVASYIINKRKFDIEDLVNGILGSLVSVTAICAVAHPWESIVIGVIGGLLTVATPPLLEKLKVDDPVGVIPVHAVCGAWGMIAVGLFADEDKIQNLTFGRSGLFRGGGAALLGVQSLAVVILTAWSIVTSYIILKSIDVTIGLRLSKEDEIQGSDFSEHGLVDKRYTHVAEVENSAHAQKPIRRNGSFGRRRLPPEHSNGHACNNDLATEINETNTLTSNMKAKCSVKSSCVVITEEIKSKERLSNPTETATKHCYNNGSFSNIDEA